jgi:hypothetical protein
MDSTDAYNGHRNYRNAPAPMKAFSIFASFGLGLLSAL